MKEREGEGETGTHLWVERLSVLKRHWEDIRIRWQSCYSYWMTRRYSAWVWTGCFQSRGSNLCSNQQYVELRSHTVEWWCLSMCRSHTLRWYWHGMYCVSREGERRYKINAQARELRTVIPHHSHRIPARHSLDQQVFRHLTHFEFVGRFPSRQWWWCRTAVADWKQTSVPILRPSKLDRSFLTLSLPGA